MSTRIATWERTGRAARAALAALSLLIGACVGVPHRAPDAPPPVRPTWVDMEHSWAKLEEIERWLDTTWSGSAPDWHLEAHLQLAEGRLAYLQGDLAAGGATPGALSLRLVKARAGFERVIASPAASGDQRSRANAGIEAIDRVQLAPRPVEAAVAGAVGRRGWGARPPVHERLVAHHGRYRTITIHHSAERDPTPLSGGLEDTAQALRRIQKAHMDGEGWADIGYHFLIDPYGRVLEGRALAWQGAHAGGDNNIGNLGICLLGDFDAERPTAAALAALERLVAELRARYAIPRRNLEGHSTYRNTACPGRHLLAWVRANR